MKKFPIKKILILVAILAVPGFLYYLLQEKGKNRYRPLAIYGSKEVGATFRTVRGKDIPDTIYHTIEDFKMVNQAADTISWADYEGKIIVLNLLYTKDNAPGVSFANRAMEVFNNVYEKNKMVHLVGVSMDPTFDSATILANYAKQFGANPIKWDMLTGDTLQISRFIKEGLLLDAVKNTVNGETKFTFSNMFVLLDTKHRIRGYYEATNQEALSKLDDEIKVLIAEELRNMRDGR